MAVGLYPDQEHETNIELNIRHVTQSFHNKGQQCTEMTRNILRALHWYTSTGGSKIVNTGPLSIYKCSE